MMSGRLTAWFEEQIAEVRAGCTGSGHPSRATCNPKGADGARLLELEKLRDEARRLEGGTATAQAGDKRHLSGPGLSNDNGGGDREPACLAKVREALRRDSKPWMRGALREVIDEVGGGE